MKTLDKWSAENLRKEVNVDKKKWNALPSDKVIEDTVKAIEGRGIKIKVVESSEEALGEIKGVIPAGAEVMNGSSTTLIEIGFVELLTSGKHSWKNVHGTIFAEPDQSKQMELRRKSVTSEYFLSSVNAIAQTGELVASDASGSRVGAFPFGAKNLILVAGVNKIAPTLNDALDRIKEYAFPLEDLRAQKAYGMNSRLGKIVIIANEMFVGRTTLILVKEDLGY
ncbi:lactate utilization protein [Candidatus Micrarchaeota archaeon]|nr:lactate utilization protein [Candidatus Micrarchaeota archaeon]